MDIEKLILSATYLEFINNLDNLIYELLYSQQGFIMLQSKEAVNQAQKVLDEFNNSAQKLIKGLEIDNQEEIIEDKRQELLEQVKKHYYREAYVWADEVYQDLIENCLMSLSCQKDSKEKIDKIYSRALSAISWITSIRALSEDEQKILINNFNVEFNKVLNSTDEDYMPQNYAQQSDSDTFFELRDLIIQDEKKFIDADIAKYSQKLSVYDVSYFKRLQNELTTYKKTSLKDEISLLDCAFDILKLKGNKEKLDFLKKVEDDFNLFASKNKKLEEEDKIKIVKRRVDLSKKNANEYYNKLITSLNQNE